MLTYDFLEEAKEAKNNYIEWQTKKSMLRKVEEETIRRILNGVYERNGGN